MARMQVLTQEHCDCLNRVLESCARVRELLALARPGMEALGLDLSEIEGENSRNGEGAARLKAAFFPNER